MHPCGVLLSDATLLDRTPVEASYAGFPMSQFDKDDVEDLGLLKLDVLGIRMQSAMAHAVDEIERVDGVRIDLDDEQQVPLRRPADLPPDLAGQDPRLLPDRVAGTARAGRQVRLETFDDIITDISLFRPGPVKSDMVTPYLEAKQGWRMPRYLHDDLRPILGPTYGVVVFHEQVIEMIARFAGCRLAEADEARRALGDVEGMAETKLWFFPRALGRGYSRRVVEEVWKVLEAFASFGFCKAHAAAFALPTYQSAWLKAHYPAHFLSGVLTHDPGMYPKRLILDDARQFGIAVLGLDVNASEKTFVVERVGCTTSRRPRCWAVHVRAGPGLPDGRAYGIRLALSEVKGISEAEVARIVAARPYHSLTDFWHRAQVSRPVVERLVLAGGFDAVYGIGSPLAGLGVRRRGRRHPARPAAAGGRPRPAPRAVDRASKGRGRGPRQPGRAGGWPGGGGRARRRTPRRSNSSDDLVRERQRDASRATASARPATAARAAGRASRGTAASDLHPSRQQAGVWEQAAAPVAGDPAGPPRSPRCSSRSTSATPRSTARSAGCPR